MLPAGLYVLLKLCLRDCLDCSQIPRTALCSSLLLKIYIYIIIFFCKSVCQFYPGILSMNSGCCKFIMPIFKIRLVVLPWIKLFASNTCIHTQSPHGSGWGRGENWGTFHQSWELSWHFSSITSSLWHF